MTASSFVDAIRRFVFEAAVDDTIATLRDGPAGRKPDPKSKSLSDWYKALSEDDKQKVAQVARESAESAIFGFFVVLDGGRTIDDPDDRGALALWHEKDGLDVLLNDPNGESLHELFNAK